MTDQQQRGAVIGPSIQIDGTLKGDEDLLIQGKVDGTIELKKNSVTIGESGHVKADIFAHTIIVEGQVEGKIVGSERVMMRKTAQIRGTLIAPRVMLEDGARFNGTIDMDPEADAIKSAFSGQSSNSKPGPSQSQPASASAKKQDDSLLGRSGQA
ncbi:MAG: polymer-forming cytoskeletal protein [Wenzhouxiangella sp.]